MDFIDYDYEEIKDDVYEQLGNLLEIYAPVPAEKEFFALDTETIPDSFLSCLAAAVYEIKKNCLTETLKLKTEKYIQFFKNGDYDGYILSSDLSAVKNDITYFEKHTNISKQ